MRIIKSPKTMSSVRTNKLVTDLASGVIAMGLTKSCIWIPTAATGPNSIAIGTDPLAQSVDTIAIGTQSYDG